MIGKVARRGLLHLPGVPHLHVNRPLFARSNFFFVQWNKKDKLNFMSKWRLIQFLQREMYKKPTLIVYNVFRRTLSLGTPGLSPRFSFGAKIFFHISHSTELVRMCLACQHFDFNSADWIFDNLHVISSWYLRTMGKEFIFFGSADVSGPGTRDEPLRTSAWEAIFKLLAVQLIQRI